MPILILNDIYNSGIENLQFFKCKNVNYIDVKSDKIPENVKGNFKKILNTKSKVFADPNESLPYNTNVKATICTKTSDPIYSKSYPYPMGVS